jgi:hypothetical protein
MQWLRIASMNNRLRYVGTELRGATSSSLQPSYKKRLYFVIVYGQSNSEKSLI